jgi:hypothetical protein
VLSRPSKCEPVESKVPALSDEIHRVSQILHDEMGVGACCELQVAVTHQFPTRYVIAP